jgi:hypothetical protein
MLEVCQDRDLRCVIQLAQAVGVQKVARGMQLGFRFHGTILAGRENNDRPAWPPLSF